MTKQTRTHIPDGVTRVNNVVTGESLLIDKKSSAHLCCACDVLLHPDVVADEDGDFWCVSCDQAGAKPSY